MNKTNKEVFELIIADKLTSLETDDFIEKETNGFKLKRLEKLITDYETYILDKKPKSILYIQPEFKFLFYKASIIDESSEDREVFEAERKISISDYELNMLKFSIDWYKRERNFASGISIRRSELLSFPFGDFLPKREKYSPIFYVISLMEEMNGNFHFIRGPIHFKKSLTRRLAYQDAISYSGVYRKILAYFRKFRLFVNPNSLNLEYFFYTIRKRTETQEFEESPTYRFFKKLHEFHRLELISSFKTHDKTTLKPSAPHKADNSGDDLSPKGIAKSTNSLSFSKDQIEFVMSYAEKCRHYDFTSTIIKEIKEDPKFSKIFKYAPADTTLRRWLDKYDEKNNIKRQIEKT